MIRHRGRDLPLDSVVSLAESVGELETRLTQIEASVTALQSDMVTLKAAALSPTIAAEVTADETALLDKRNRHRALIGTVRTSWGLALLTIPANLIIGALFGQGILPHLLHLFGHYPIRVIPRLLWPVLAQE